jgi:hypothetical protein
MPNPTVWLRACASCGTQDDLVQDRTKPGGVKLACRECFRAMQNTRRLTPEQRQARKDARARYDARHPGRKDAQRRDWGKRNRDNPHPDRVAIGSAVRQWRLSIGATGAEMAALVRTHETSWLARERGFNPWPLAHLEKLRLAGCPLPELIPPIVYRTNTKTLRKGAEDA